MKREILINAVWCSAGLEPAEARCFRFRFTGAVGGEKRIVIDGQARMRGDDGPAVDAVFWCDAGSFLLLMCGRINFSIAVADGLVLPEGDVDPARGYQDWGQAI